MQMVRQQNPSGQEDISTPIKETYIDEALKKWELEYEKKNTER